MSMKDKIKNNQKFFPAIIILAVSAAAYLPFIRQFGYTFDDWYLMWAAKVYGWRAFQSIYSIDRPLRAFVMMPEYIIFGQNVLWYNLFAWGFRVLSALTLYWIVDRIWPKTSLYTLWISILYIIFPGFLSQINGIDYQAQMISLSAAMISIGLTLFSIAEINPVKKWGAVIVSILLGWIYLGLVEYEIGFEVFRLLFIYLFLQNSTDHLSARLKNTFHNWLPFLMVPIGFLTWRLFFFQAERKATDINLQLGTLVSAPVVTLTQWFTQLLSSSRNVLIYAWITPLKQLRSYIQLIDIFLVFVFTISVLFVIIKIKGKSSEPTHSTKKLFELLFLGAISAVAAIIPIILVNRTVSFPYYSRYSLVSSIGTSIFIVSFLFLIKNKFIVNTGLGIFLFAALLSNNANSRQAVTSTQYMNNFWWQVSWRAPMIEKNTTIITSYQDAPLLEDYFIWGPANLIYYPAPTSEENMQPGIYAAIPNKETIKFVNNHVKQMFHKRRNIITYTRYQNFLLLSQPSASSCVHFINGNRQEISTLEDADFAAISPYSDTDHIIIDEKPHIPPAVIFGNEPVHEWCYFYQKTDLARQAGDWVEAARLGDEALANGFYAADQVEWLPFLQAFAVQKNTKSLEIIDQRMTDPNIRKLACSSINSIPEIDSNTNHLINTMFCQ